MASGQKIRWNSRERCVLLNSTTCIVHISSYNVAAGYVFQLIHLHFCILLARLIAILSVCLFVRPSVTRVDQSKAVQAKITKSSLSAAWKTLVSETVKLLHKFKGGHFDRGR